MAPDYGATRLAELVRFKPGVNRRGVHPLMWIYLGPIAVEHHYHTSKPLYVTSQRRPLSFGASTSKHSPPAGELCTATDIRTKYLAERADSLPATFARWIQKRFGNRVGVLLEPDWLSRRQLERRFKIKIRTDADEAAARKRVGPHIHLQLKGKLWTP